MRNFILQRDVDVSGVSGTGMVAQGCVFSDGTVVMRWLGDHPSTVLRDHIDDVEAVHGHGGTSRIIWLDE